MEHKRPRLTKSYPKQKDKNKAGRVFALPDFKLCYKVIINKNGMLHASLKIYTSNWNRVENQENRSIPQFNCFFSKRYRPYIEREKTNLFNT